MLVAARFRRGSQARDLQWAHALRAVPFLRDVPAADLVAIWRRLQERRAAAGTLICARGEPGAQFYLIQSGELEVTLGLGPEGIPLRRLGPGDFFGEMSLLTGAPRSADVQVLEDALLWVLERRDFEALLASRRSLLQAFTRALAERVAAMTMLFEERTAPAAGPAGLRFGSYRAVEQIGVGGMSTVYSAVHVVDQTAAAVKVLPAAWGKMPELRERLRREATALRGIAHPRVIAVLEAGAVDERLGGGYYLAMEWIPHALDRVLRAQYPEPLDAERALSIARGVAEGLGAIHVAGFVHRDVKPSNILLRPDGTPVLTDLGLAAVLDEAASAGQLTPTDVIMGTADYISPEQVAGLRVDERSDLYALGIVLYEMAAGHVPYAGRTPLETLRAQVDEPPPPLPARVAPAMRALIERALQKDPARRHGSAAELIVAIDAALARGRED
jgi:CRP-like cAMP-binding protein/tRNA A-37 threonylcarbamoyl transferase component Bud32